MLFVSRFYSVCCLPLVILSSLFFKWTNHKQYKGVLIVETKAISHTKYITVSSTNQLCAHCLSVPTDHILSCLPSVPEDYIGRRNLEHVEALQENPVNPNQIVIGYGRGLMVIWDLEKQCALQHIPATQVTIHWQAKYKSVLDKQVITITLTLDICLVYFACNML